MRSEPGLILDVTRLVSRLGQGPLTGIDRVELEWLRHLHDRDHLLICRVSRGQLLLSPEAGVAIMRWIGGDMADLPPASWLDRLRRTPLTRARAERALIGYALHRAGRSGAGLAEAAHRRLGRDCAYLNLGHANLDRQLLGALAPITRVVMIHDTIPLDHPEYTRKGQSQKFRDRFMIAVALADLILTVSQASADQIALWRGRLAVTNRAPVLVTPIGTAIVAPEKGFHVQGLDPSRGIFVSLGTIEPRKNHGLLLDAWDRLASRLPPDLMPYLLIVGRRGWENAETFARLDRLPRDGFVRELSDLDDHQVAALLERAHALLMPSFAEGFGMPLTEAAARGIPILSAPQYLPPGDAAPWVDAVAQLAAAPRKRLPSLQVSGWNEHFQQVGNALMHQYR